MKKIIKDHPCSKLWTLEDDPGFIYKWQPKFLTENEIWCLEKMFSYGFAPYVERHDFEIIKMDFIQSHPVTDIRLLFKMTASALDALSACGIRHGDLARPNVIVHGNSPILIDFAESRLACDPRRDKRPEGDKYWLNRTIKEIIDESA